MQYDKSNLQINTEQAKKAPMSPRPTTHLQPTNQNA